MNRVNYEAACNAAELLRIVDQTTGTSRKWKLNREQRLILKALCEQRRVIIVKPRQIGATSISLFFLMLFAAINPGIKVATVTDTQRKSTSNLKILAGFMKQAGIKPTSASATSIELPNGTTIDALSSVAAATSGESRVGRGQSYQAIHMSEVGLWSNDRKTWNSLMQTLGQEGTAWLESTMSAASGLFRTTWTNRTNNYHHVFLGLEQHEAYQRDENEISEDEWEQLKKDHGFSSRPHAAWFHHLVKESSGGSVSDLKREYPIREEDLLTHQEGRWIHTFVPAENVLEEGTWEGEHFSGWHIYREAPAEGVIFGVDIAKGGGGDHSTITVMGKGHPHRIHATYTSRHADVHVFPRTIIEAAERFRPQLIVIELDGPGWGVVDYLHLNARLPVVGHKVLTEKTMRLRQFGAAIEAGEIPIGPELQIEIASSVMKPPKGPKGNIDFQGRDDILASASIAYAWLLKTNPKKTVAKPPAPQVDFRTHYVPTWASAAKKKGRWQ